MKERYQTARPASGRRGDAPCRDSPAAAARGAKFAQERRLEVARIAYLVGASGRWYE